MAGLERGSVTIQSPISGEELAAMGDIGRCELVAGKIIMLSPTGWRHGQYEQRIGQMLGIFVQQHSLGEVLVGEVGIYTRRNPDTVRGADVLFISHARLAQLKSPSFLDVAPELIVEVLSPDDRWIEVNQKIHEYFAVGVDRVWVVDPSEETVWVFRSPAEVHILTRQDTLVDEDILPGFSLPLASLFTQ